MTEMVAEYDGKHQVRLRKSEINFGTAQHVYAVSVLARGELLICAAGDDISAPNRCTTIVHTWIHAGKNISCIHSAANFFTSNLEEGIYRPAKATTLDSTHDRLEYLLDDRLPFLSPTCAYSIKLFRENSPLIGGSIIEDGIMSFRSLLAGKVVAINKPLVNIRVSEQTAGTGYKIDDPNRWNRFILSRIISYANIIKDIPQQRIDDATATKIGIKYKENVSRLASLLIHPSETQSTRSRLVFALLYMIRYPTDANISNKFIDAIRLSNISNFKIFNKIKQKRKWLWRK